MAAPEAARVLTADEWEKVAVGFFAVDAIQRASATMEIGDPIATATRLLEESRGSLYSGANALRRYEGVDEIGPGDQPRR